MSDYAASRCPGGRGAVIKEIEEGSIAQEAGLLPGMIISRVDGTPLLDIIDWLWLGADDCICLEGSVPLEIAQSEGEDEAYDFEIELERESGESWGIVFDDCIFDGMRLCKNACVFCFMSMLPKDLRPTLYMRDDDYRLSFLQGNFVSLSNLTDEDVERICALEISPLHVSLHAVEPDLRQRIMGRNAQRGLDALERILDAGLQVHTQIVLVPELNDGEHLDASLRWIEERPGILSCGIVPLGYTRFQTRFDHSFNEPAASLALIQQLRPYQERSRKQLGCSRFYLADEFYLNAGVELPEAEFYDDFAQYEDGIGMVRSFIDDWAADSAALLASDFDFDTLPHVIAVCGLAFAPVLEGLIAHSPLLGTLEVLGVKNDFFGGNVDVSGLLCAADVIPAIQKRVAEQAEGEEFVFLLPPTMFNSDGLTLDGSTIGQIEMVTSARVLAQSCKIELFVAALSGVDED